MNPQVKLVVVGDISVGKSTLLTRYTSRNFPEVTHFFIMYKTLVRTTQGEVDVHPFVTGGGEEYDRLRPLSYPDTDVFLLCFSVSDRASLDNVKQRYTPELRSHCPAVPYLLVGCKTDLRTSQPKDRIITAEEGNHVAVEIGAACYLECSSLTGENVDEVLERAALTGVERNVRKPSKKCTCL